MIAAIMTFQMRALGLAVCLFTVALVSTATAQGKDPLTGTWKLNLAKSTYPAGVMPPQSGIRRFEDLGGGFIEVATDGVGATGQRTGNRIVYKRDGREYTITALTAAPVTAFTTIAFTVKSMSPYFVEYTTKIDGKLATTATEVVSTDGKTYTTTVKGTNAQGQPITTITVYDRQ